ncbi:MAG TPA: SPFH domain-containing protein [Thermomicrobiales bacterium]|nr:SPFH domain-containing protein [Thermomicrobiales bacterium]
MGAVIAVIVIVVLAGLVSQAIRVVREYRRLVVFRVGKCIGARGPGPVLLIPFIDRPVNVDLRELFIEIPHQSCITKDNVPIQIDFLVYRQVIDAVASVIAVANFAGASQGIAATTLRAIIGDFLLDDVLARREQINDVLRRKLDEVTERWGVKVTAVEIREILPPRDVQEAMNRQMSAERTRRAAVTEAEGRRQATITVAEGDKQAQILQAEGTRQARMLEAEGYAQALQTVFSAAHGVDAKTMTLQVIDGLKALGASPASTFVIPMDFTRLFGQFGDFLEHGLNGREGVALPTGGNGGVERESVERGA